MQEFRRILIVRTDRIGDVILTLPMARVLKRHFPAAHIAMLLRRYTAGLVEDNRDINQILFYDDGQRLLPFFRLVTMLRSEQFDIVFHTYPRFRLAMMTWFAGIPVRVGTGYRWYSFLFNKKLYEHRKDALHHELEYNLNLLTTVDCTISDNDNPLTLDVQPQVLDDMKTLLVQRGVRNNAPTVIVHPGSGGSAREWSPESFGMLARRLFQKLNVNIIFTGGKKEKSLVDRLLSVAGIPAVTFVDELNLKEYAALAKLSTLFVGNSTGPLHIAAAVGTPVVGIYPQVTALNATRWGPVTSKKTVLTPKNKPSDCTVCIRAKQAACECMSTITVDEAFEACLPYLSSEQLHD